MTVPPLTRASSEKKKHRDDQTADEERDTPTPLIQRLDRQNRAQDHTQKSGEHYGCLLAGRLPAHIKSFVSGSSELRQIDEDPAELHPGRKPLQESAKHDKQRR